MDKDLIFIRFDRYSNSHTSKIEHVAPEIANFGTAILRALQQLPSELSGFEDSHIS